MFGGMPMGYGGMRGGRGKADEVQVEHNSLTPRYGAVLKESERFVFQLINNSLKVRRF